MSQKPNEKAQDATSHNFSSVLAASKQPVSSQDALNYPALHLYPLNDTFVSKQINLAPTNSREHIKIGRYSNNKTVPSPVNGYFDSKVLSRAHAEVWYENDKVYIKDIKSSNGTFINGTRLSPESQESEPFELHSEDVVDFGIDILTDDNKDILHRRVACRVFLVMTPEDALKLRSDFTSLYRGGVHGGSLGNAGLCPGAEGGFRRNKSNVNVDQVIMRLQSELQKSSMVGSDLHALGTSIQKIHDTLEGGAVPVQDAPYQELVPASAPHDHSSDSTKQVQLNPASAASLETQLANTHNLLASHVEKIKHLEETLASYERVKDEFSSLKCEVEEMRLELRNQRRQEDSPKQTLDTLSGVRILEDGFDDATSVGSVETVVADASHGAMPDDTMTDHSMDASDVTITKDEECVVPPSAPTGSQDSAVMPALLSRIERLEKALQQQPQRLDPDASSEKTDFSFQEWKNNFERRWEEQTLGWKNAQQKINDAFESRSLSRTPKSSSFTSLLIWLSKHDSEMPIMKVSIEFLCKLLFLVVSTIVGVVISLGMAKLLLPLIDVLYG